MKGNILCALKIILSADKDKIARTSWRVIIILSFIQIKEPMFGMSNVMKKFDNSCELYVNKLLGKKLTVIVEISNEIAKI